MSTFNLTKPLIHGFNYIHSLLIEFSNFLFCCVFLFSWCEKMDRKWEEFKEAENIAMHNL